MGTIGKKIVRTDLKKLISQLNKALADEWLAYYQYWIGSKVIEGAASARIQAELKEHAEEEFKHANMLTERILQLGGVPILNPQEFSKQSNCGYEAPKSFSAKEILKQNIKGEQCAIKIYDKLLKMTEGKDILTYHMLHEILEEEVEHEDELEKILSDISAKK